MQVFVRDASLAWRQLFAWLSSHVGNRDDRPRVVDAAAFELSAETTLGAIPLHVRLVVRRADHDHTVTCVFDPVAARHLSQLIDVKWSVVEAVGARSPGALARLVADSWSAKVGSVPLRWRIVDSTVRAILTPDYVPINDLELGRLLEHPLRAVRAVPTRAFRSGLETRVEFVVPGPVTAAARGHQAGFVLRNSETGHAAVSLSPALVRSNGFGTRLIAPTVEQRHVVADKNGLGDRLTKAVPSLLQAAQLACRRWNAIRNTPWTTVQSERAAALLDKKLGRRVRSCIFADFIQRPNAEQTPSGFYRAVAIAIRDLPPRRKVDVDPLLSLLLADDVVFRAQPPHASSL